MAKIKKIILSAALLGGVLAVGGGLTTQAAADGLVENFDYSTDAITTGGASNYNIYSAKVVNYELAQVDGVDALKISHQPGQLNVPGGGEVNIRDNAAASSLFNQPGSSLVIKTRFKMNKTFDKSFKLWFGTNEVNSSSRTYNLLRMRKGEYRYQMGTAAEVTKTDYSVSIDTWHEAVFVLYETGADTQDKIYTYIDNQLIYSADFNTGDDFNGKLTNFGFIFPQGNYSEAEEMYIDYVSFSSYQGATPQIESTKEVTVGTEFSLEPTLDAAASIPNYNVTVSDETKLEYNKTTGKFTALAKTTDPVTVKFDFVDELIEDQEVSVVINESVEPIKVSSINQKVFVGDIALGVGETYPLDELFQANPTTADNPVLSYEVLEGNEIVSVTDSVLTGLKTGTAKLKVSATDGSNVTKEVTIKVGKGVHNALNAYELTDTWTESGQTHSGLTSVAYSNKTYSPISVVEDSVFGKAIKFTGVGSTKNGSGSHLDIHFPVDRLSENKDYKVTGWVKMVNQGVANVDAKLDVKIIAYYNQQLPYGYPTKDEVPYHMVYTAITVRNAGNDWVYFETNIANMDTNAIKYDLAGLKVEIGTYNTQEGIDAYITHVNLAEQDTVEFVGWELTDANGLAQNTYNVNAGSTFQLNAVAVPSSASMNASFESSDETIATVDANGLVTILDKAGTVTIKVKVGNTEKEVTFVVTKKAQTITGNTNLEIAIDEFDRFTAASTITVTPADTTSEFTIVVANDAVCKAELIDGELWLSDLTIGTTTITITAKDNAEATLVITVTVKGFDLAYDVQGHGEVTQPEGKVTKLPSAFPTLTATGYTFGGWFLDAACTQAATEGAAITANTTLYAKWTEVTTVVEYTITYNVQGHGTAPQSVTGNKLPESLPVLTATGYTFGGWFLDEACTQAATEGAAITANTTLYAKWTENSTSEDPGTTPTPETPSTPSNGLHPGAIAGIVIAVVVTLGLAGGLVFYFMKKKKTPKTNTTPEDKE